jgi:hypothetical protein
MNKHWMYVYGISATPITPGCDVLSQNNLVCISIEGMHAIVKYFPEDFSEDDFIKKFYDPLWLEKAANEHMNIICKLMGEGALLPFKLGTFFKDPENLRGFIKAHSVSLTNNLLKITGREEWSLKIYANREQLPEKMSNLSAVIQSIEREILRSSRGKAFILKQKKNQLMRDEMEKFISEKSQEYCGEIQLLCDDTEMLTKHFVRDDNLIFNLACLVKRHNRSEFTHKVLELRHAYTTMALDLTIAGPWPPFSFINIKEKTCHTI